MRPSRSGPHSATRSTLDVHPPPAWRENRSNLGNLISLSKSSTAPKPPMRFRNLISTPFPLFAAPETRHRTYLVPRLSSRSFLPILLQFRLRLDHRRLRMSTGGSAVFRQPAYTLRTRWWGNSLYLYQLYALGNPSWSPEYQLQTPPFTYHSSHSFAATPLS